MHVKNKKISILLIIILVFLIFRLLFLCSNMVFLYSFDEAQKMKLVTHLLILKKPLGYIIRNIFDYQYEPYHGGSLVNSILYIPIAYLLGINTFSFKLLSLLFSLGTLVMWYIFLCKFFNKQIAIFYSILFIFAPPVFTTFSLINWGAHGQSTFFIILGLFLLCSLLYKERIYLINSGVYFLIFGLLCGFSLYFVNSYSVAIIAFLILWLVKDYKFYFRKNFLIFVIGFLIGFTPWILARVVGDLNILIRGYSLGEIFLGQNILHVFGDIKSAFLNIPILSPCYKHDYIFSNFPLWFKITLGNFYRGVFIISFLYLILYMFKEKKKNIPLLGIILYIIIFILIYSITGPLFHYPRHSVPLYPFVFAVIGIALGLFLGKRLNIFLKIIAISIFFITVLISAVDNFNLLSFKHLNNPFEFKGYQYGYLLKWLVVKKNYVDDLDRYIAFKERNNQKLLPLMNYFPYEYQEEYQVQYGGRAGLHWTEEAIFFIKSNLIKILNGQLNKGYSNIENWGWSLGILYRWNIKKCSEVINQLNLEKVNDRKLIYYNLGLGIGSLEAEKRKKCIDSVFDLNPEVRHLILKGIRDFDN